MSDGSCEWRSEPRSDELNLWISEAHHGSLLYHLVDIVLSKVSLTRLVRTRNIRRRFVLGYGYKDGLERRVNGGLDGGRYASFDFGEGGLQLGSAGSRWTR
jgi:hypothetical protein